MRRALVCTYKDKVGINLLVPPFNHVVAVRLDYICRIGPSLGPLLLGADTPTIFQQFLNRISVSFTQPKS